jgi:anion-transporting  ArsA/GET3 family ATPase
MCMWRGHQVISTDPAHSLGDLLEENVSGGEPVPLFGCDGLFALEIDARSVVRR